MFNNIGIPLPHYKLFICKVLILHSFVIYKDLLWTLQTFLRGNTLIQKCVWVKSMRKWIQILIILENKIRHLHNSYIKLS